MKKDTHLKLPPGFQMENRFENQHLFKNNANHNFGIKK